MRIAFIIGSALLLLIGLINAEKKGFARQIFLFKVPLSLLFIIAWSLQPARYPLFSNLVLVALVFCLAGDVLLAVGSHTTFLFGLVSFLLGHLMYAAAFFPVGKVGPTMAVGVMMMILSAVWVWRWLEPHLSTMQVPVMAYITVISIMVAGAFSVYGNVFLPEGARVSIFAGAVLFYLSDLFVARERFIISNHVNRLIGLPLYYGAQFLLAFSAAGIPG